MTLRHKGSSKWTKRIKERGIDVQDEGTRTAIAEQQHLHALLTRKMNSMKDGSSSSSDDSSDEDDVDIYSAGSDQARASKLLEKAKEKTLNLLDEDDEVPNSGVLSLPFMVKLWFFLLVSDINNVVAIYNYHECHCCFNPLFENKMLYYVRTYVNYLQKAS